MNQIKWFLSAASLKITVFLFCLISIQELKAQVIVYKKDSTQLVVKSIDNTGKTRRYSLENETGNIEHYISSSNIDSIRYADGRTERFVFNSVQYSKTIVSSQPIQNQEDPTKPKRNFIGLRPMQYFFAGNANIFYERYFVEKNLGWKNNLIVGFNSKDYLYEINNYPVILVESGANYYFLRSQFFRFSAGASLFGGKVKSHEWENSILKTVYKFSGGLLFNGSFWVHYTDFYASLGLDLPLGKNYNTASFVKFEVAYNF